MEKEVTKDQNELIISAHALRTQGEFDESYARAQRISPDMPGLPALMGWHLIRLGKFLEGFTILEKELGIYRADAVYNLPKEKRLQKLTDAEGKKILYVLEGGSGDEIAYARFAPLLKARGIDVVVGASSRLAPVIARMSNMPAVVNMATCTDRYDYYIPAMSIITLLGIDDPKKDIPFPYLLPQAQEVMQWKTIIEKEAADKTKIGIHWQGNWDFDYTEQKSPPAHEMLALQELGCLFSLQRDAGNNTLPENSMVFDTELGAASWERTIAVISLMDYIVTNDTSTAHLAGALGKKTLVVLPHAPHHYWLPLEDSAAWYPAMYCFRQPQYNDWHGAIRAATDYAKTHFN